ncbi:hypothetical protein, partial [Enterococcus faecalis]|uniref:hypothetical protein n=1 Tax=Enterococcus faecalis TaxID=1351 RepID=UPI00403F1BD5
MLMPRKKESFRNSPGAQIGALSTGKWMPVLEPAMPPGVPVGTVGGDDGFDACRLVATSISAYVDNELDSDRLDLIET